MDPKTLFKPGLTVPEHELRDLHYIGEALPVPSLITTSISIEADANTGGSPVPAREDHQHAVDVDSLIQFINDNDTEIDLTNYYTKAEADAIHDAMMVGGTVDLANYYTKAQVDGFIDILVDAIDDLDARVLLLEAHVNVWEKEWTYGTTVAPDDDVILGYYIAFRDFIILEMMLTLVNNAAFPTSVRVFKASGGGMYSQIYHSVLTTGDNIDIISLTPEYCAAGDGLYVQLDAVPGGDGEVLVVGLRGLYVFPEDVP